MSNLLSEYQQARAAAEAAVAHLESLKADPKLQKYQDFEKKLRLLMNDFGMSLVDINILLDQNYKPPKAKVKTEEKAATQGKGSSSQKPDKAGGKRTYKKRSPRLYTNPHDQTTILYMGGVNKALEGWKEKWGADVVKTWGVLQKVS